MKTMQPTGDADHDFAMMMKHHHQSAVDMAKIEVANGTDARMRALAQKLIDDSKKRLVSLMHSFKTTNRQEPPTMACRQWA